MASVSIGPGCFIANHQQTKISGQITIGSGNVIHPSVVIVAESGPIIIGDNNLIEEQAVIVNKSSGSVLVIGNGNVFEVGAKIDASTIGNDNVFEAKCIVGQGAIIGTNCHVGAACTVYPREALADHTIVYGSESLHRVDATYVKSSMFEEQLAYLKKIMPSFHQNYTTTS